MRATPCTCATGSQPPRGILRGGITRYTYAPRPAFHRILAAMTEVAERPIGAERDFLPLEGTDYVELWVGNAKQSAYFYRSAFGLRLAAYCGPETGVRDRVSYVLEQGSIRFVLTAALAPEHPIADHVRRHGDGVRDIALAAADVDAAYREATRRGARDVSPPSVLEDAKGCVKKA